MVAGEAAAGGSSAAALQACRRRLPRPPPRPRHRPLLGRLATRRRRPSLRCQKALGTLPSRRGLAFSTTTTCALSPRHRPIRLRPPSTHFSLQARHLAASRHIIPPSSGRPSLHARRLARHLRQLPRRRHGPSNGGAVRRPSAPETNAPGPGAAFLSSQGPPLPHQWRLGRKAARPLWPGRLPSTCPWMSAGICSVLPPRRSAPQIRCESII